jgi:hypothetical protein
VPTLTTLAASPLATTATFSTVHFSMSEIKHSSLVASSASSTQVVIEISTDPIKLTFFLYFQQVLFLPLAHDFFSLTFTVSSVVLPISIASLAVTFIPSLMVLRVGADPPLPLCRQEGMGVGQNLS